MDRRVAKDAFATKGIDAVYIPPYSPWYNPVEFAFSWIKRRFRRGHEDLHLEDRVRCAVEDGHFIPTVLFEPVVIGGTTIRRATGHNARYVHHHGIDTGARIVVTRSGDVIPQIVSVIKRASTVAGPDVPHEWTTNRVHFVHSDVNTGPGRVSRRRS